MPFGLLDDGFDENRKVLALLDSDDLLTAGAAIGLWTTCLSWVNRNTRKPGKAPGVVPAGLVRQKFGPFGRQLAGLLVEHGLWDVWDGPEGAWKFHDFEQSLPTKKTREARAEAGRRGADARWHGNQMANSQDGMANSHDPDGKLPSDSHDVAIDPDGKPIANDGSRARTRAGIPYPNTHNPFSGDGPSGGNGRHARAHETPPGGQAGPVEQILAGWIATLPRQPQSSIVQKVGEHVAAALADSYPLDVIAVGVAEWQAKGGLGPGALPAFIHDAGTRRARAAGTDLAPFAGRASPPPGARASTTDTRVGQNLSLVAELRAEREARNGTR